MFSVAHLLLKTVVRKFYERNAGFFLFIFFLMFGVVQSTQIINYHLSLIYGLLSSSLFLMIVCIIWILYLMKCFAFVSGFVSTDENNFLLKLNQLSISKRFVSAFLIFLFIDLPVLIYVGVIISVAIHQKLYSEAVVIILFHLLILTIASLLFSNKISSLSHPLFRWPSFQLNRPIRFPFFYLSSLLNEHKIVLLATKAFSFFAIIGFMNIPLDHIEYRTALMGVLFGVASHAVIVFEFRKFEENYLTFFRNLPISSTNRFVQLALVYFLLLLPEGGLLVANHVNLFTILGIHLFATGLLILSHCRLYAELNNDKHIQFTLWLFLISFMLVLFKIYLVELVLAWALAYYYFNRNFYQFELNSE
jgi:hypothetical protein